MNTPTVIARTKTFKRVDDVDTIISERVSAFYFLPPDCACYADVPIGSQFALVIVPDGKADWRETIMEVTWSKYPKVDAQECRYYRPVSRRILEADEIEYLRGMMQ
jgi:hypothetical protein